MESFKLILKKQKDGRRFCLAKNDINWGHAVLFKEAGDKFAIFNPWGKHKDSK